MKLLINQPDVLILLLCQTACILAAGQFCSKYLDITRAGRLLFPVCLLLGLILLHLSGEACGSFQPSYILLVLLKHLLFMGSVLWFFQASAVKKILTASVLITVLTLTENFCESFLSCLLLFLMHIMRHTLTPFPGKREELLLLCFRTAVVILILFWTTRHFNPEILYSGRTGRWHVILAVPLLGITAVIDMANWGACNGILVRSSTRLNICYDQLLSHGEICILTGLSMFAAACYLFGMQKICLEQEKNSRYHTQITCYQMLEEQYRQSERLRHDMKNHIIALSGLLAQEELEKSRDYLKNMEQSANPGTGEEVTGNSAVDALLYQKRASADKHGIRWICDVQVPSSCSIPEFDLCVLFGNLLDNALEACIRLSADRDRFLTVQAGPVKQCFLLEIRNSTEPKTVSIDAAGKKHFTGGHGIGLLNVQDVIRKYDGTWKIDIQEDIFTITLLLPMGTKFHI